MRLYLSSYRLGNHADELVKLIGRKDARVAVSVNALDFSDDLRRKNARLAQEMAEIETLGFKAEKLDLRDYFDNDLILEHMREYDAVWFSGGNTFILAKAFRQSGFDVVIEELVKTNKLVYSGYSAAFCVLNSSLHGIDLVDDNSASAEGYETGEIWEGVGLIDFYPVVHFRSGHNESDEVEKLYDYVIKNDLSYKTFKDGDVYLAEDGAGQILTDFHD